MNLVREDWVDQFNAESPNKFGPRVCVPLYLLLANEQLQARDLNCEYLCYNL
jgi:hypothetical protein